MKIAAYSATLIQHSIHEAMSIVKRIGFDGIEIAAVEPHLSGKTSAARLREMRSMADGHGLDIPAIGGYMGDFSTASDKECEQAFSDFQRILDASDVLGAGMIRVFPGGPNAFLAQDYHYAKSAFWLHKCAAAASEHGKRIVFEIHNGYLSETVDTSLQLVNSIGAENAGLIHDAGNMYIVDTDCGRDSVIRLGSKLFHVHVKDVRRVEEAGPRGTFINFTKHGDEKFKHCLLGEGEVRFQPLFDALREAGYSGWVTLEPFANVPAPERLAHDLRKVRQMLGLAVG